MKASELAAALGGTLEGDDVEISACAGLEEARAGDLTFCKDARHVSLVEKTKASAVLLPHDWDKGAPCATIRVDDPNTACMAAAKIFAPPQPVRAVWTNTRRSLYLNGGPMFRFPTARSPISSAVPSRTAKTLL